MDVNIYKHVFIKPPTGPDGPVARYPLNWQMVPSARPSLLICANDHITFIF